MKRLVFASGNKHKVAEIAAMLEPHGWSVEPLVLKVDEDRPTFAGNAEKKARAALAATGLPSLADDSGLEVDALDGAPGVLSARFAGPAQDDAANNAKLLTALRDVPDGKRTARFRCALCFVDVDGTSIVREGAVEGAIVHAPRGAGGFGYDPLFLVEGTGSTMAELTAAEKNRISHRSRALAAMIEAFEQRSKT